MNRNYIPKKFRCLQLSEDGKDCDDRLSEDPESDDDQCENCSSRLAGGYYFKTVKKVTVGLSLVKRRKLERQNRKKGRK